ncbi:MAG TPA: type 2 lanthipeptide synthetase LanM family protein [Ktedonosporobacter sp.]|nr:type 2 lanthipeptide synthetase LanM family protein [Ktedonosporobacter sp.]
MIAEIPIHEIINNPAWYKALTLTERQALLRSQSSEQRLHNTFNADTAERILQSWKAQYPFDKERYFSERLALDDLNEDELRLLSGEEALDGRKRMQDTPTWLRELVLTFEASHAEESDPLTRLPSSNGEQQRASRSTSSFLVAISPLLTRGGEHLRAELATLLATFPAPPFDPEFVQRLLLDNLARQLLPQISRTLTLELHIARLEERLTGATPEERFHDFVRQLSHKETLLSILEEYAPLARMLMVTIEHWLSYNLEFLRHLCTDWDEIRQVMTPEYDPGLLVEITSGIGDLHKRGRSTLKLRFASGFQLMYKPRSLAIDEHFQQLLVWLNERGDHPSFRTIQIMEKGTYGWSEFVSSESCTTTEQVGRFYERQGGYLALLYALEATDFHHENLIASGEHPVMIDLEALFHPRIAEQTEDSTYKVAAETMQASVLRVGLLPRRIWGNQERAGVDISGLGGKGGQLTPQPVLQIEAQGTEHMRFIRQHVAMPEKNNRPTLAGQDVDVLDYTDRLLHGFSQVYRLLMTQRDALLAGPIQAFAHDEIRVIVRATRTYAQLLFESYHPDLLRDTLERDRFFDRLWVGAERQPHLKKLITAERTDLHAGDIPMFTARADTRDIATSWGKCIPDFLAEPSMDSTRKRLQQLSEEDLARQTWFIQASLATILMEAQHSSFSPSHLAPTQAQASQRQLIQAACVVGDRLCERALLGSRGANWLGLTFVNEREWSLLPAGADLYSGVAGIALFLAYLGAVTGIAKYTALARAALASEREQVKELREPLETVGGYNGWGGIIYLYTHLGVLWQDQALLHEAEELVGLLPKLIDKDQSMDVIAGSAGCILCLLSLYHVLPSAHTLALALQCGDHLLARAAQCGGDPSTATETGRQVNQHQHPLTGFSHGAAGIALSLLKLAALSGQERFRDGAVAALEYERSVFSPERQNWPDFRELAETNSTLANLPSREETPFMATWCHGAPGIGLGRLASLPYLDDALIRDEIDAALQTTLTQGFGLNHSLCHGDLGNLETLLVAAHALGDQEYQAHVERLAAMILASIETHGWLTGIPLGVETPGLMTGIAGIGYQCLRLAEPERVPSVLVLAPPSMHQ